MSDLTRLQQNNSDLSALKTDIEALPDYLDTSDANATAGDVLNTKTAYVNGVKVTGNMPNNGALSITPSTSSQSIPAGYTSGGTVSGDANLVQANIRSGVTIFDVTGTFEGGGKLNIVVQNETPTTYVGIWIKSDSFTYTNIREISDEENVVASNINILVKPSTAHSYKTIMMSSDVINGLNYEFDDILCTDSNGDILYEDPLVYYGNGTQWIDITPQSYEIVPFATATDTQISKLLTAHYKGTIDLSTIWNVGDVRTIHIDALSAPVAGSNKAHTSQDMRFRIIGFNHDTLTTSINNMTKAAVTIECSEVLANYNTAEDDYISGNSSGSSYENPSYWNNAYRRTWLNNNFISALPSTFNTLIKEVVKGNLQGHSNTSAIVSTNDKAFLLSYPEVFGQTSFGYYRAGVTPGTYEGTQYAYYSAGNSKIKYRNNNGEVGGSSSWWLRSPSSSTSYDWCYVNTSGSANYYGYDGTRWLAPALCI